MKTWSASIYSKTALAHEELATRSHGLGPRLRQLLILIDGQRTEEQLVRLIPREEFDEYLPVLEKGGFIVRQDLPPAMTTTMIAPATTIIGSEPAEDSEPPAPEAPAPAPATPGAETFEVDPSAGAEPAFAAEFGAPEAGRGADPPQDEDAEMRQRLSAAVRAVIGEQGDELAERIERCGSRRELRDLMPAALSIVEIVGGRKALKKFQEQAGLRSS
ncbi:MAG: hypothetical protein K0B16_07210 [Burkholderiaceae bacterium]|nr:hypothetical protein [Burkholderiaceae bacterium]